MVKLMLLPRLLVALIAIALPVSAHSASWVTLAMTPDFMMAVDRGSIVRTGEKATLKMVRYLPSPKVLIRDAYQQQVMTLELDCAQRTSRSVHTEWQTATGERVAEHKSLDSAPSPATAGGMGETWLQIACENKLSDAYMSAADPDLEVLKAQYLSELRKAGLAPATASGARDQPARRANARTEGDRLLAQARATDLFTNETERDGAAAIRLRHKASAVLCVFDPGRPLNRVSVLPTAVRGEDVGCTSENVMGIRSTFITKTAEAFPPLVAKEMAPMVQRYKGLFKGEVEVNLEYKTTAVPVGQEPRNGATIAFETNNTYERAVFFRTGDWVVETRFTAPPQLASDPSKLDDSALIYVLERERHLATHTAGPR